MRIAITGGNGFIGRHLADRLLSEGHEPVRLVRTLNGTDSDAVVVSDLSDVDQLARVFAGCQSVAHCAGINRERGTQTFRRVHIKGTRNVVEAAKIAGIK